MYTYEISDDLSETRHQNANTENYGHTEHSNKLHYAGMFSCSVLQLSSANNPRRGYGTNF